MITGLVEPVVVGSLCRGVCTATERGGYNRMRIEDSKLHQKSRPPENRNKETKRARDRFACGHDVGVTEGESGERNNHQDNEDAVNPEELPQEWVENREVFSPIQNPWSQRARDQD